MDAESVKAAIGELAQELLAKPDAKMAGLTEDDIGTKFIKPMLDVLGWDTRDMDQLREQHRTRSGPTDYELLIDGKPRIIVESKKPSKSLDELHVRRGRKETGPEQAMRYAWHARVDWVVLTNFKETRLYCSRCGTEDGGLIFSMKAEELAERSDELAVISRESVASGRLDAAGKKKGREPVDREILVDLNEMRKRLHGDISGNKKLGGDPREITQIIMDRLLVMRVAEDRGILGADFIKKELDLWREQDIKSSFIRRLRNAFTDFGEVYNTSLFNNGPADKVQIKNSTLEDAVSRLYKYDFGMIDSDVLGSIYENYLTASLMETDQSGVQIIDNSKKKKKKLGIYYTPSHLVEYILDKTLGERLAECKTPDDVSKVRVLDPSCGSGSFLIKAFDVILRWYHNYNANEAKKGKGLDGTLHAVPCPEAKILKENLFGIDIDPQAAEIAAVNLMLKALKKNQKLETILGRNIVVGNSLVDADESWLGSLNKKNAKRLRPLDIGDSLPAEKFDIIVGNPPYFRIRKGDIIRKSEHFEMVQAEKVNASMLFVSRCLDLLSERGRMGLVLPKACAYTKGWTAVRSRVMSNINLDYAIDCGMAFDKVLLEQMLLIGSRGCGTEGAYTTGIALPSSIREGGSIAHDMVTNNDMIYLESSPIALRIREKMLRASVLMKYAIPKGSIVDGTGIMKPKSKSTVLTKKHTRRILYC